MRAYHFLSSANALNDLICRRLKVSRYADLNDPFELLANIGDPGIREALTTFKEDFNKRFGLLCFCREIKSPLLWAHYGEKHHGICLGFDIPDEAAIPINYVENRIVIKFVDNDRSKGMTEASMRALITTKFDEWKYEKEVRLQPLLTTPDPESGLYFVYFGPHLALREVIVGASCEIPLYPLYQMLAKCYGAVVELSKAAPALKWYAMVKQTAVIEKDS